MERVVFMGTPEIAESILLALINENYPVVGVVTQPDKPKGRGNQMTCSPVKELAVKHGIKVLQPVRLKEESALKEIYDLDPDLIVLCAYGKFLPASLLSYPKYGCICVHMSLLPKYRGAAPIQWAVLNGDAVSGVSIMYMDEGCDTGDIIAQRTVELAPDETGGSLYDKLALAGAELLSECLPSVEDGTAVRNPQRHEDATFVTKIDKTFGKLDFSKSAAELERYVRGLNPWPCAYTFLREKLIKFWQAQVIENRTSGDKPEAGTIVAVEKGFFDIQTGDGLLRIKELQLEGKRRMSTEEFLRGYPLSAGDTFV